MNFFTQRRTAKFLIWLVALAFIGTAPGWADDVAGATTKDLEKVNKELTDKISDLESKLASLERRLVQTEAGRPTPAVAQAPGEGVIQVEGGDIHMGGFIDTSFNWNFSDPRGVAGGSNGNSLYRSFDQDANTFNLNNIQFEFSRPAPETGGVGFKTEFMYGADAQIVEATGFLGGTDEFSIQEGYLDFGIPIGAGLTVLVGKFATLHGAEVIENHLNWNASRSLMFNNAIPFTHTGVRALYEFMDGKITTGLGLVNGWDNVIDNNDIKDIEAMIGYKHSDNLSGSVAFMHGSQQDDDRDNERGLIDAVVNWKPLPESLPKLDLKANFDYGWEEDVPGTDPFEDAISDWIAYALYARYELYDWLALATRWETFWDDQGRRGPAPGNGIRLWEMTYTADVKLYDNLLTRLEYRHDHADSDAAFDSGTTNHQDTVGVSMIYLFG